MTDDRVKVFVGCAPNGDDAESMMVLEHGLRSRCTLPVDIVWMQLSRDPQSPFYSNKTAGWRTELWATPFSGFRWAVPELCGFAGRAIYMDSDILPRRDFAELWRTPLAPGRVVVAKGGQVDGWRFCVSLWDCDAARRYVPKLLALQTDPQAHNRMKAKFMGRLMQSFLRVDWNVIDGERYVSLLDERIGAIHYSSEAHQPQLVHAMPRLEAAGLQHWFVAGGGKLMRHWRKDLIDMFEAELEAAKRAGYTVDKYVPAVPYGEIAMASRRNYGSNHWAQNANR